MWPCMFHEADRLLNMQRPLSNQASVGLRAVCNAVYQRNCSDSLRTTQYYIGFCWVAKTKQHLNTNNDMSSAIWRCRCKTCRSNLSLRIMNWSNCIHTLLSWSASTFRVRKLQMSKLPTDHCMCCLARQCWQETGCARAAAYHASAFAQARRHMLEFCVYVVSLDFHVKSDSICFHKLFKRRCNIQTNTLQDITVCNLHSRSRSLCEAWSGAVALVAGNPIWKMYAISDKRRNACIQKTQSCWCGFATCWHFCTHSSFFCGWTIAEQRCVDWLQF